MNERSISRSLALDRELPVLDYSKRIPWTTFDPETLKLVIEREARNFILRGFNLETRSMNKNGRHNLSLAIGRYYDGGLPALKATLAYSTEKAMQDQLTAEASKIKKSTGNLNVTTLRKADLFSFYKRASRNYPGGWTELVKAVEESEINGDGEAHHIAHPRNFWTEDQTRSQARIFLRTYKILDFATLRKFGRYDIANAVAKYPGKMPQLQADLGIKPNRVPQKQANEQLIELLEGIV